MPSLATSTLGPLLLALLLVPNAAGQDAAEIYQDYCAGCHGARLEGGYAAALVKTEWKYGRTKGLIVRNISYGIEGTEMGAFNEVLSEDAIRALADYIGEAQDMPLTAPRELPEQIQTKRLRLQVDVLVEEGLNRPWSLVFTGPGQALLTEQEGAIRVLQDGTLLPAPIANTPRPYPNRFGGFMGLAIDPDYATNGWVYLAMTESAVANPDRSSPAMTKIVRGRIEDHTWIDQQTLFEAPASLHVANGNRWGGRLAFDHNGYLYFTIGDLAVADGSQDPTQALGKTYRIHPDGSIPADNPYADTPGALGAIYTLGNRNTQGLAIHPETGAVWSTDHGPMGGDEINILTNGANYGWPIVTFGIDYNGETVSDQTEADGMTPPVMQWTPSTGVSAATFVTSEAFPDWRHNLLVGSLAYEDLRRLVVDGDRVMSEETLFRGYGRVRDVVQGPDGAVYVVLNRPDRVVRLR